MKKTLVESAGWYGVVAILAAYALLSFNIVGSKTLIYQFLNLSGAIGIIIEAASKKDKQPVVLNIVWAIIALFGIFQIIIK